MSYSDEELRDGLLAVVDTAASVTADEAIARAQSQPDVLGSAPPPLRGGRRRTRRLVVVRLAAALCLVAGLAAIVALRLSNGGRVSQPTSVPPARDAALTAVACLSPTFCLAVGQKSQHSLAAKWNGTSWTPMSTPDPAGATQVSLTSLSCPSEVDCVAVGTYQHGGTSSWPFAESWDGTSWLLETLPLPSSVASFRTKEHVYADLAGLSCASSGYCLAVGEYLGTSAKGQLVQLTLVDLLTDGRWSVLNSPPVTGLWSVSCLSDSYCVAIGATPLTWRAVFELWNGRNWSVERATTSNLEAVTSAISCTSTAACVALAPTGDGLEGLSWNGRRWSEESAPSVGDDLVMMGLSCASPNSCTAVGTAVLASPSSSSSSTTLFADRWNGSRWSVGPPPSRPKSNAFVEGISCVHPTDCMTAGSLNDLWNGKAWRTTFASSAVLGTVKGASASVSVGVTSP